MSSTNAVNSVRPTLSDDLDMVREELAPAFDWSVEFASTSAGTVGTGVPYKVALDEGLGLVVYVRRYWEPDTSPANPRPGLNSARLPDDIAMQLLSLFRLTRSSSEQFILSTAPRESLDLLDRGEYVLGELKAAIQHHADDGEVNELDAQVDELARLHTGADSFVEVAQALDDYAAVAEPIRNELDGLGGFDASMIEEARDLALKLRVAKRHSGPLNETQKMALAQRNRYLRMLWKRVLMVRRAAQYVFRHHPKIAREATSAYRRQKSAEARRLKLQEEKKAQGAA